MTTNKRSGKWEPPPPPQHCLLQGHQSPGPRAVSMQSGHHVTEALTLSGHWPQRPTRPWCPRVRWTLHRLHSHSPRALGGLCYRCRADVFSPGWSWSFTMGAGAMSRLTPSLFISFVNSTPNFRLLLHKRVQTEADLVNLDQFPKFHRMHSCRQEQIELIWQEFLFPELLWTFLYKMLGMPQILNPIQIAHWWPFWEKKVTGPETTLFRSCYLCKLARI